MKDGYIKVAAATPKVKVADTVYNGQLIKALMKECTDNGAKVVVFPELCITGYTCQDLFWQDKLIAAAEDELIGIADYSRSLDGIFFIGLPYEINGMLYNMAAVVSRGEVLAMVPKTFLPNYNEFYEARHFASGENLSTYVTLKNGQQVSVDTDFIFSCKQLPKLKIAVELCEDLWTPNPPSIRHAMSGATVIVNLSASDEVTGKAIYRRELVSGQSARLICGYIYASAGDGESTQDVVYSGHNLICENGNVLADDNTETQRYTTVSIQYKFEDGSEIPNTAGGTFTVPYGTKLDLTPAKTLYDYEFIKVDGLNKPIVSDGTVVTYYYKNKNEEHTHNLTLVAAKAATCTEGGKEAYYKCEGCGKFYEDVLGTKEITDLASWGNIAKIAHTTKQTVTKATPTANGKIVNYCSVCKKTLSTTVITKASSIKLKATSLTYNGKVRTPKVIVKDRTGKTLVKNTDYTVSYAKGRKYVGKYAVKITFKGKYSGTKTLYFTIKPKATSISSLKAGSKKFTVKWKKQATQTTGYQVQYSASSKFSKAKTVTVGKNTTVSKKISKLSGKKKYYVRVRTYKTVKINGKSIRIYSGWSKAKTVTTKK